MRQTKQRTNRLRYILYIVPIILSLPISIITSLLTSSFTSALDYSSNTNIQFTFNPTISVSISGNLSIGSLSPGNASDSNIIGINVATNNVSGYSLSATVGTNTSNTDLTNIANSSYKFTNLSSNVSTLTSFNDNTWGYSYSTDNGANWVSGSVGSTLAGYNGLPLDTNTNANERGKGGITLIDTYNAVDSKSIKFKIGARASSTQASGTYNNTINFYVVAHDSPKTFGDAYIAEGKQLHNGYYTMQDMTSTICDAVDVDTNIQLIDIRDNEVYMVSKLKDNRCWMLDNLRLGGNSPITITNQDTNMVAESWELPGSINTNFNSYTEPQINSDYKYNTATNWGVGSGKVGVYYNYCSASAGTYCYTYNSGIGNAVYDICPNGWHIPTSGNDNGEYPLLYAAYNNNKQLRDSFSILISGNFYGSTVYDGDRGSFWSSTGNDQSSMYLFVFNLPDSFFPANKSAGERDRRNGNSIRCLAK